MLLQLPEESKDLIKGLFKKRQPNNPVLWAYLYSDIPGITYVDNVSAPSMVVCVTGFFNWTFVSDNADISRVEEMIQEICKTEYLQVVWNPLAVPQKPVKGLEAAIPRFEFIERHEVPRRETQADIRLIDSGLFEKCEWKDIQLLAYTTKENFLEKAFGFCVVEGEEVCCECYASFAADTFTELGVITAESKRRKGYASAACLRVIDETRKRGLTPTWSCDQDNLESVQLAQKLGFHSPLAYEFLYFPQMRREEEESADCADGRR